MEVAGEWYVPTETTVKSSRKFRGLTVFDACSTNPNVSACFGLLLWYRQEPSRKCSAAWWRSQA